MIAISYHKIDTLLFADGAQSSWETYARQFVRIWRRTTSSRCYGGGEDGSVDAFASDGAGAGKGGRAGSAC
jgi:hypothetical protein